MLRLLILQERDFRCPHEGCDYRSGDQQSMDEHVRSVHAPVQRVDPLAPTDPVSETRARAEGRAKRDKV